MTENIAEDDPKYATKHAKQVGLGWYWLPFILLFSIILTSVMAVIDGEFSLWPGAFIIALLVALHHLGKKLNENGYVDRKDRIKQDG